jgi:hypothetical protein
MEHSEISAGGMDAEGRGIGWEEGKLLLLETEDWEMSGMLIPIMQLKMGQELNPLDLKKFMCTAMKVMAMSIPKSSSKLIVSTQSYAPHTRELTFN